MWNAEPLKTLLFNSHQFYSWVTKYIQSILQFWWVLTNIHTHVTMMSIKIQNVSNNPKCSPVLLLSIFPLTIAKFQLLYNFKFLIRYGEGRARFHSARFWDSSVLLHVSVLHYFLFLIFYVEYTINYPLICEWTLEYLKFLAIMNKSSHLYKSFCG